MVAGVLGGLLVASVTAGCTAGPDGEGTGGEGTGGAEPASGDEDERAEPPRVGPLDELLATIYEGESSESSEAQYARLVGMEEIIATCMREQGFDYTPIDYDAQREASREAEADGATKPTEEELDPVAATREYGYGVFTERPGDEEPEVEDESAWGDPNAERYAAMSQAEQQAWDLALNGPGQGEEYAQEAGTYDWTAWGCYGVANHEQSDTREDYFDVSAWLDLINEILQLDQTIGGDPRMAEVVGEWSVCMAEAGHPGYTDPSGPWLEMIELREQVWAEVGAGVELDVSTDDYLTDPAYLAQQADIAERHAELAPREVELAVADATCQVEVDYARQAAEVRIVRQEEFAAEHSAELEAMLAAYQEFDAAQ
jgi:hypothetical protein